MYDTPSDYYVPQLNWYFWFCEPPPAGIRGLSSYLDIYEVYVIYGGLF